MKGDLRMKLTRRLECAVQVVDDFTGKPISGSGVTVYAPDLIEVKPVRKNDGFFLFMKGNSPLKKIIAGGPAYTEEIVEINLEELENLKPVIKIRLRPGRTYFFPKDITGLRGLAKPESTLELFCKNGDANLSLVLLQDYTTKKEKGKADNNTICLFSADKESLIGKTFVILSKEKEDVEIMTIQAENIDDEQGVCHLTKPLTKDYMKGATRILPLYKSTADKEGNYVLPIKSAYGEDCQCKVSVHGGKWQEVEIKTGNFTVKNF